jgi:hypothetical protein
MDSLLLRLNTKPQKKKLLPNILNYIKDILLLILLPLLKMPELKKRHGLLPMKELLTVLTIGKIIFVFIPENAKMLILNIDLWYRVKVMLLIIY